MSIWRGSKSSIACVLPCAGSLGFSSLVTMRASPPWNFWRGMRLGRSQNPWQPRTRGDNDGQSRASEVRRHAPTPRQPERTGLGWCGEAQGGCQGVDHVPWGGRPPCRAHVFRLTQGARRTPCDTCDPSSTTPKAWRSSGPSMAQTGPCVHHVTVFAQFITIGSAYKRTETRRSASLFGAHLVQSGRSQWGILVPLEADCTLRHTPRNCAMKLCAPRYLRLPRPPPVR